MTEQRSDYGSILTALVNLRVSISEKLRSRRKDVKKNSGAYSYIDFSSSSREPSKPGKLIETFNPYNVYPKVLINLLLPVQESNTWV